MNDKEQTHTPDHLLSEREAAKFLGIAPGTLRVSRSTGPMPGRIFLPYLKFGRTVRYDPATLREWLDARVVTGDAADGFKTYTKES
jgi:hypothetical protein